MYSFLFCVSKGLKKKLLLQMFAGNRFGLPFTFCLNLLPLPSEFRNIGLICIFLFRQRINGVKRVAGY